MQGLPILPLFKEYENRNASPSDSIQQTPVQTQIAPEVPIVAQSTQLVAAHSEPPSNNAAPRPNRG